MRPATNATRDVQFMHSDTLQSLRVVFRGPHGAEGLRVLIIMYCTWYEYFRTASVLPCTTFEQEWGGASSRVWRGPRGCGRRNRADRFSHPILARHTLGHAVYTGTLRTYRWYTEINGKSKTRSPGAEHAAEQP